MPNSTNSSVYSRHSSPEPGVRFDPFLVLENHREHSDLADIVVLGQQPHEKYFCPTCLESRSAEDVTVMELGAYNKFVCDLFEMIDRHIEMQDLRKIVLIILETFLSKRPFVVQSEDIFHFILRVLKKVMKSDLYNQNEFVTLATIMSGLSIRSLHPIPLRSAWEAWGAMLDYGARVSLSDLINQDSQNIPVSLTRYHIGQAIIVKSYVSLINDVAMDWTSELVFVPRRQRESVYSKYFLDSQIKCQEFTKTVLIGNCDCYLFREAELNQPQLDAVSNLIAALRECFISATRRKDEEFLTWLNHRDMITTLHKIFTRNASVEYRSNLWNFLKTYVLYYMEKEYGESNELREFMNNLNELETVASRMASYVTRDNYSEVYIFYLLLNWLAIKINSRYFFASRVKDVLMRQREHFHVVSARLKSSPLFMRVFAFIAARSKTDLTLSNEVINFLKADWDDILTNNKPLSIFRFVYCHEPVVFEWAHRNALFLKIIQVPTCETIAYLIDRGVKQNHLISTVTILLTCDPIREVFKRYIKRHASSFFQTLVQMGTNGFDSRIMRKFSGWLPPLLQEIILRYIGSNNHRETMGEYLIQLFEGINLLLSDAFKLKFYPHFDEQFVIDFVKCVEITYLKRQRAESENYLLLLANKFIALLIQHNDPCVMKLIQYIDFTLFGYMHNILDTYEIGDCLGEEIARVLIAYKNLDYPLEHNVEQTLCPMSANAYEWMMSNNPDLHALALILMDKLYQEAEPLYFSYKHLSNQPRVCLVTGFLHMLCTYPRMIENRQDEMKILRILKFDDFKYHSLYEDVLELVPELKILNYYDLDESPSSPDISFASAGTNQFEEEQISVSRILEQLNEDEGYRSASVVNLPRNLFLSRAIDDPHASEEGSRIDDWERRAFEGTQGAQSSNPSRLS